MAPDVDLAVVARGTPGMSGADLSNLVNEAALFAVRRGAEPIHMRRLRGRPRPGAHGPAPRVDGAVRARRRRLTAYHEAGHAVCAAVLPHADPVHKVTILPTGMALGVTQQLPAEERHIYGRTTSRTRSSCAMGGRIAEELVFGVVSTGANNDLVGATELARKMVREWGMSDRIGPMAWGSQGQVFLGEDLMHTRDYSDDTARVIDEEVERILREQEDRCRDAAHRAPQRPRPRRPRRCSSTRRSTAPRSPASSSWPIGAPATVRFPHGPTAQLPRRARDPTHCDRRRDGPMGIRSHRFSVLGQVGGRGRRRRGCEPGSRASATAAHRSVAVTGPTKEARTTPSASATISGGHGVDAVAAVDVALGADLDVGHRHRVALQRLGLGQHAGAGVAGGRGEHGHQPGDVRARRSRRGRPGPGRSTVGCVGASGRRRCSTSAITTATATRTTAMTARSMVRRGPTSCWWCSSPRVRSPTCPARWGRPARSVAFGSISSIGALGSMVAFGSSVTDDPGATGGPHRPPGPSPGPVPPAAPPARRP